MQNLSNISIKKVIKVFNYIKSYFYFKIIYNGIIKPGLIKYSNTDFIKDYETRKFTFGYLFTLNNGPIN
jgi:hypothetical protein